MIPEPLLILILSLILIAFGAGGTWLFYRPRLRQIRSQEWKAACLYYDRKHNPGERRI